jgi:hypothetical protein
MGNLRPPMRDSVCVKDLAIDSDHAFRGFEQPHEQVHKRALAAPRLANKTDSRAFLDRQ